MAVIEIAVPSRFDLASAVFSYGWALLAPNQWRQAATNLGNKGVPYFRRPLHTSSGTQVVAQIHQPSDLVLHLETDQAALQEGEEEELKIQVGRMLRLTAEDEEAVKGFQGMHSPAHKEGFGRLLRSPTVWEDLVKCILLCNCGWGRTVSMNQALCQKIGKGAFPRASDMATADPKFLQNEAGLGYRAKSIIRLAQQVVTGETNLDNLEDMSLSDEDLLKKLVALPGIGPFSANNMLQLLGRYQRIACDSETVRHFRDHHKEGSCTAGNVEAMADKLYASFAPYQFLAYWHELWHCYEQLAGPFRELDPEKYGSFTGRNMTEHLKGTRKKRKRTAEAGKD